MWLECWMKYYIFCFANIKVDWLYVYVNTLVAEQMKYMVVLHVVLRYIYHCQMIVVTKRCIVTTCYIIKRSSYFPNSTRLLQTGNIYRHNDVQNQLASLQHKLVR